MLPHLYAGTECISIFRSGNRNRRRFIRFWQIGMECHMLVLKNLEKRYSGRTVLKGISFQADASDVLGILGPNGAGKSSVLNIIAGVLAPEEGQVLFRGRDMHRDPVSYASIRANIGYVPEHGALYPELQVGEYLKFCAQARFPDSQQANRAMQRVMDLCRIGEYQKHLIRHLSKGYGQRVAFAQAIMHNPELLILDEPFSGLDSQQTQVFIDLIEHMKSHSLIILSSHHMAIVRQLCNRVIVLEKGEIRVQGGVDELRYDYEPGHRLFIRFLSPSDRLPSIGNELSNIPEVEDVQQVEDGFYLTFSVFSPDREEAIFDNCVQRGFKVREIRTISADPGLLPGNKLKDAKE